ncbi:alpha/beta hydrolase family protein [Ningiella sp. W23]|uniref:alpha/beta hydrolase family protein n=1 Tax=Ningiella sp. W23 TaxID=3023715 RepID=UPI003757C0A2
MLKPLVLLSILFSFLFHNHLQAQELISVESYAKLPRISLMAVSPSADRFAYRQTEGDKSYLIAVDLKQQARVGLVDISAVNPRNIYFVDEDKIILTSEFNTRLGGFRGRHDVSFAVVYDLQTKKLTKLLEPGKGIYKGQSALGRVLGISADKKYAYMPAYKSPGAYNLYRVQLTRSREPRIHQRGTSDTIDFFVGYDGEVLARERYDNESNLHRIEARLNGKWKEIFREETELRTKGFDGFTPDYKHLVFRSQNENGRWAYYTIALADGSIEGPLFSHADKDVESLISGLDRVVHGVRYSGFKASYEFFDKRLNARLNGIAKAMPNNTFTLRDHTQGFEQILFYMEGELSSGDYVIYNKGALDMVASARKDILGGQVHNVSIYEYEARDGLNIPSLLTLPSGVEPANLPAIMLPHGGPESYDTLGFDYFAQYFASQGYAVIQPQFRGSKGFGLSHLLKGRGKWGQEMQDDLTDAVNDLAKRGIIDSQKVCIVGGSYGGYAALAGATFTPDVYQCAVSINGVSDLERMMKTERMDHGSDHWVVSYWERVINAGTVSEDFLEKISPVNFADRVKIPILLIHGERDSVVKVRQSTRMEDALEDADKDVTFVRLKKGDHYLSGAENRMQALKAIDSFIKQHL